MTNSSGATSVETVLRDLTLAEKAAMTMMLQAARDAAQLSGLPRVAHGWHAFASLLVIANEQENNTLAAMERDLRP